MYAGWSLTMLTTRSTVAAPAGWMPANTKQSWTMKADKKSVRCRCAHSCCRGMLGCLDALRPRSASFRLWSSIGSPPHELECDVTRRYGDMRGVYAGAGAASNSIYGTDRNVDEAAAEPPEGQRRPGVGDGFIADVLSRPVVDLRPGLLDDAEHHNQPAARLELTAGQAAAHEVQALAPARRQKPAVDAIPDVAGACPVVGELNV